MDGSSQHRIEPATPADADGIRTLLIGAESPFDVEAELSRTYSRLWVARRGSGENQPVGVLLAWEAGDTADLIDLVVAPAERRQGFGRALVETLLAHARVRRLARVVLEARASNLTARRLYERLGFREVGERRKYYSDGENAALYELLLEA